MSPAKSDYLERLIWQLIDADELQELKVSELKAVLQAGADSFEDVDGEVDPTRYIL